MTENEYLEIPWGIEDTIENLKTIKEHFIATVLKVNLDGKGKQDAKEVEFDFNRAIQALEEIQQYREYKEIFESHFSEEVLKLLSNKEEFGKWLERGKWIAKKCDEINRELEQYQTIDTIEKFKDLKEKSVAKKMSIGNDNGKSRKCCGNCRCFVLPTSSYCSKCGQKLDWQ